MKLIKRKIKIINFIEFILIGFLAVGFSETAAVVQFAVWGLLMIMSFYGDKNKVHDKSFLLLIGSVVFITFVGLLLLAYSPANLKLLAIRPAKPITLVTFLTLSLQFGLDFIVDSLKSRWLPFFVLFCSGVFFGFSLKKTMSRKNILLIIGIAILSLYIVCVATSTPSVLLGSVYPENRALFPSHYFLVITLFVFGFLNSLPVVGFLLVEKNGFKYFH